MYTKIHTLSFSGFYLLILILQDKYRATKKLIISEPCVQASIANAQATPNPSGPVSQLGQNKIKVNPQFKVQHSNSYKHGHDIYIN